MKLTNAPKVLGANVPGAARRTAGIRGSVVALAVFAALGVAPLLGASSAEGDVGDLGAPPTEVEVKQTLVDFYNAATRVGSSVDVQFAGPVLTGPPQLHANPPPDPWCVRCGYPDQGISPMYPVMALVVVKVDQNLETSALSGVAESTVTHNGTSCAGESQPWGESQARFCPAYYFYRDGQGNWQVA